MLCGSVVPTHDAGRSGGGQAGAVQTPGPPHLSSLQSPPGGVLGAAAPRHVCLSGPGLWRPWVGVWDSRPCPPPPATGWLCKRPCTLVSPPTVGCGVLGGPALPQRRRSRAFPSHGDRVEASWGEQDPWVSPCSLSRPPRGLTGRGAGPPWWAEASSLGNSASRAQSTRATELPPGSRERTCVLHPEEGIGAGCLFSPMGSGGRLGPLSQMGP